MWRWLAVIATTAIPAMAAETDDRSKPILNWGASPPILQALHLPDVLVSGGRLLRMVYGAGFVDEPWEETYLIETNEDGRPATVLFEIRYYSAKGIGRDKVVTGKRELTASELTELRAAFVKLRICSTPANGDEIMDVASVHFEFADEERYCFAGRPLYGENYPEFSELLEVIGRLSGIKGPRN